jgi:hypothetical protein
VASLLFLPGLVQAFGAAGASSSPYLKLPMGARATGMGEAFTGIADDDQAMFYNPAGLTQLNSIRLPTDVAPRRFRRPERLPGGLVEKRD